MMSSSDGSGSVDYTMSVGRKPRSVPCKFFKRQAQVSHSDGIFSWIHNSGSDWEESRGKSGNMSVSK